MGEFRDPSSIEWQPVRPDVARGVFGKALLSDPVRIVLTRVAPGGAFTEHRDGYGHFFFFLSGTGRVRVGERCEDVGAGAAVRVKAGQAHSYENTGASDLTLLSVNLPEG